MNMVEVIVVLEYMLSGINLATYLDNVVARYYDTENFFDVLILL